MIIWKFKEEPETRGDEPGNTIDWPCKAFRRVIEFSIGRDGFHLGLVNQHQWKSTGEWRSSHVGNLEVYVNGNWAWGAEHFYYDGPHCMFSLGFIHFHYPARGGWCKKCMPDDDSPCYNGECEHSYHQA